MDTPLIESITIRVYGIMINSKKGILVSDEHESGMSFTKFPGGGLEHGEGTRDCLIREWREETKQEIRIVNHFYTTDFFQRSAFKANQQVISIYYTVSEVNNPIANSPEYAFDFEKGNSISQSFRWLSKDEFSEGVMTFPIDQVVARLIIEQWNLIEER